MGVSLITPGESTSYRPSTAPTVRSVGARASEWLPDLQAALLPTAAHTVRELAHDHDPRILRDERPGLFAREVLHQRHDVGTWSSTYPEAITRYALRYAGVDPNTLNEREQAKYDELKTELTTVGTGRDTLNTGLEMLEETIVPLLEQASTTPRIVLALDGPAWTDVGDERTAERALETIALFGEVCEVHIVCSPQLEQYLDRHHPEWCDEYCPTESRDGWGSSPSPTSEATQAAWETINGFAPNGGRLRLIEALSPENHREVRELKADPTIKLAAGTVDRYVQELADEHGLVAIDTRPRHNRVRLTKRGAAAQTLLGPNHETQHPAQTSLDGELAGTTHETPSIVWSPADDATRFTVDEHTRADRSDETATPAASDAVDDRSFTGAPTAEEWLATTGTASEAGYVQWLEGPTSSFDTEAMHERLLAGRRVEGVTCVDEPVEAFEDGRVSCVSCVDEHAQVVAQWGGALPTLVRITSALLSEKNVLVGALAGRGRRRPQEGVQRCVQGCRRGRTPTRRADGVAAGRASVRRAP